MITCVRQLEFDAGHRVHLQESKCRNAHGHRYRILFEAQANIDVNPLDPLGRVIDFSVIKACIAPWIDRYMDHGFLVYQDDMEIKKALYQIAGQKVCEMPDNPTAENIADHFLRKICPKLLKDTLVTITTVTVFETPNCFAVAKL